MMLAPAGPRATIEFGHLCSGLSFVGLIFLHAIRAFQQRYRGYGQQSIFRIARADRVRCASDLLPDVV